eukprot:3761401-Rhodomonas_salina.1
MIDALSEETKAEMMTTEAEMMTTEAESQPGDDRAGAEAGGPGGVVLEGEDGARAGRSAPGGSMRRARALSTSSSSFFLFACVR